MEGLLDKQVDYVEKFADIEKADRMVQQYGGAIKKWRKGGPGVVRRALRRVFGGHVASQLKRCAELSKEFRQVQLDASARRVVEWRGFRLDIPLLFSARLPMPAMAEKDGRSVSTGTSFNVTAKTPAPTAEALQAIKDHGHKFDWLECWWVPKDLIITEKNPDPILVGAIATSLKDDQNAVYFELHRWIDTGVEDAWWAAEGY